MNQERLNELYYKIKIKINDNTCFVKQKTMPINSNNKHLDNGQTKPK